MKTLREGEREHENFELWCLPGLMKQIPPFDLSLCAPSQARANSTFPSRDSSSRARPSTYSSSATPSCGAPRRPSSKGKSCVHLLFSIHSSGGVCLHRKLFLLLQRENRVCLRVACGVCACILCFVEAAHILFWNRLYG